MKDRIKWERVTPRPTPLPRLNLQAPDTDMRAEAFSDGHVNITAMKRKGPDGVGLQ